MSEDGITTYLAAALPQYLRDLEQIVNIDSGTFNKAGVDAVGLCMEEHLLAIGCEVTRYPHDHYGDTLVARLAGVGEGRVLLVGHGDTVYPDGTVAERPFTVVGDRARGPGVSDMKNGLVAAVYALRALVHTGRMDFGEVLLVLNSDEEVGSPSSTGIIDREAAGAVAALVLESGRKNGAVVVARKGVYQYNLTVRGRSAHAGVDPARGRNAILELAHKVIGAQALNGLSEGTTVNVGVMSGGLRPNVVPDSATCEIDVRVRSLAALDELDARMMELVSTPAIPDTHIEVERGFCFPPMERNERNQHLYHLARDTAARLGITLKAVETGGASDANHISAIGVPVLDGLGPIGEGAHSPDESLYIPSVVPRTALLAHVILELCGNRPDR